MDEYNAVTEAYPTDAFEEKYADTAELYSLYTFNDTAASGTRTAAADRSGNGHDAKLMGSAAYVYDGEKDSKVLYTNGTSGTYLEFELPKNEDGTVSIDETMCTGCSLCKSLCKFGAIEKAGEQ